MAELILFTPTGPPCLRSEEEPGWTVCGRQIGTAPTITEAQALVYCNDDRCVKCARGHHQTQTHRNVRR